jgi:hypothetical protein
VSSVACKTLKPVTFATKMTFREGLKLLILITKQTVPRIYVNNRIEQLVLSATNGCSALSARQSINIMSFYGESSACLHKCYSERFIRKLSTRTECRVTWLQRVWTHHVDVIEVDRCPRCELAIYHVRKMNEVDAIRQTAKWFERCPG